MERLYGYPFSALIAFGTRERHMDVCCVVSSASGGSCMGFRENCLEMHASYLHKYEYGKSRIVRRKTEICVIQVRPAILQTFISRHGEKNRRNTREGAGDELWQNYRPWKPFSGREISLIKNGQIRNRLEKGSKYLYSPSAATLSSSISPWIVESDSAAIEKNMS